MIALFKALQVLLAICILIIIHEFGHFTFAKLFGIRVEKFYLFFDVNGKSLFHFKKGDTEYGIGWLPLGGYCKISGMVDESMDLEQLKRDPQPWEFRSHSAWQRLLVMAGGVLFNFLFAILVFSGVLFVNGQSYIENDGNAVYVNDLAYEMGFRNGDMIISYDDYIPCKFNDLQSDLARRKVHKATVLRGGDTVDIYIDRSMIGEVLNSPGMFDLAVPFILEAVQPGSQNEGVGLVRGDRIISVAGTPVHFVQDSRSLLEDLAGQTVEAIAVRQTDTLSFNLKVDETGKLGILMQTPGIVVREYGLLESIPAGCGYTFVMIRDYVRDLGLIFTPSTQAYKSVGSFIAIGQVMPSVWDWLEFFYILALLSVMLGVMNLLPIPALDGGHIVITLYEIVTGKKPGDKFLVAAQIIGMVLILALVFLAFGNDIGRLIQ